MPQAKPPKRKRADVPPHPATDPTMMGALMREIYTLRNQRGITDRDLAATLGLDLATVYRYEILEQEFWRRVDRFTDGAAKAFDMPPAALWQRALTRWKRETADPEMAATTAEAIRATGAPATPATRRQYPRT